MKVSINWLKELVDLTVSVDEVVRLLPLRTIGTKEVTENFLELDMKGYNRADLLSLRGVAYEIAAITESKINFEEPNEGGFAWIGKNLPCVTVKVENKHLAPIYCIARIEGLKVNPSPDEWVRKLDDSGMRSVNNIADITNLIMLEYGQPLHAFDAKDVAGETIIVRNARAGEKITTLDGKHRSLDPSDLLITDSDKALGIAGVMGGKDSEVKGSTDTILLEAAIFDGKNLRKTAQRLGLSSEASKRFQHGLTKKRLLQALDAAIKLYQQLGGELTSITLVGDFTEEEKTIYLNQKKLNSLIGVDISKKFVESSLIRLGFIVTLASHEEALQGWNIRLPFWRVDINIEEDLIEEVARIYGYENIPAKSLEREVTEEVDQRLFEFIYELKSTLVNLGLTEVQTYSFYSTTVLNNLEINKNNLIKILNPISSETEYMRDYIWPNLVEKVTENLKYFKDVAIFEIGKIYLFKNQDMPEEKYHLSIALSNETDNPLKELWAILQKISETLNLGINIESQDRGDYARRYLHPTKFSNLQDENGKHIGGMAEVHPRIINQFGTEKRVASLELEIIPLT